MVSYEVGFLLFLHFAFDHTESSPQRETACKIITIFICFLHLFPSSMNVFKPEDDGGFMGVLFSDCFAL